MVSNKVTLVVTQYRFARRPTPSVNVCILTTQLKLENWIGNTKEPINSRV
jgi:hypothetical protein